MRKLIYSLAAVALLAGCATLEPTYERPAQPTPNAWPQTTVDAPGANSQSAMPAWQAFYTDAKLRAVIERALIENRDLRVAALNIERARSLNQIQRAALVPGVNASASGSIQEGPNPTTGATTLTRQYGASVGLTSYEVDFFGRVRSLNRATLQSFFATEAARDTAEISLVAQVASTYLAWAGDIELLALANSTLETQEKSLELTRKRFDAGASSILDVRRAETIVEAARADAAQLSAIVAQDENALTLLVGAPVPAELRPTAVGALTFASAPLPLGLPSEVLLTRPDVRSAEHALRSANANIGAARAAFFPRVAITGAAGQVDARFENLFSGAAQTWSFAPSISIPIFDGGARRGQLGAARADRDIAVAQYEKSIQTAFREVADALAANSAIGREVSAREALSNAAQDAHRISEARYRQGIDNYLSVLDAQRESYTAQRGLVTARVARAVNLVTLYKTLGGGYANTVEVASR